MSAGLNSRAGKTRVRVKLAKLRYSIYPDHVCIGPSPWTWSSLAWMFCYRKTSTKCHLVQRWTTSRWGSKQINIKPETEQTLYMCIEMFLDLFRQNWTFFKLSTFINLGIILGSANHSPSSPPDVLDLWIIPKVKKKIQYLERKEKKLKFLKEIYIISVPKSKIRNQWRWPMPNLN